MSRGHGSIERYLIEEVNRRPDPSMLNVLVASYAKEHGLDYSSHLRSSFRRAANKLAYPVVRDGERIVAVPSKIHLRHVWAPTCIYKSGRYGNMRETIVVFPKWMSIEDDGSYLYRDGGGSSLGLTMALGLIMIDGLNRRGTVGLVSLFSDEDDDDDDDEGENY